MSRRLGRVLANSETAEGTWWLELEAPDIARSARPGQFVMVGFGLDGLDPPLLPRPFSIGWRGDGGRIGLLVREFGDGTRRLSRLRPGDDLLLLGPLGRGFSVDTDRRMVCVAGGVGLAPFLFLAPAARAAGATIELHYGERTGTRVFDTDLIERLTGIVPTVYTEDGAVGRPGRVISGIDHAGSPRLYGCGPTPMLRALEAYASARDLWLQVSVEEHMGCGIGTCQGCVVLSADGRWIKSCTEGPVFERRELTWPG